MPRNNEDRTGAVPDQTPPVEALTGTAEQAPLQFVTPTEFVELPTKGELYPESHPLHGQETVEIRYMTAKDEDILASKTLLKKGIAVDRFIQNVLVDKKVKVEDLIIGDKNAIIVAARITGYGSEYEAKITCPACMEVSDQSFDLDEVGVLDAAETDEITRTTNNTFLVTVPKSGVQVEFRPLTSKDELHLSQMTENKRRKKLPESLLTDQLKQFIVSVNGSEDRSHINQFINSMPTLDSHFLRTAYRKAIPNLDLIQTFTCQACSYEADTEVPFTAEFFWPKRRVHG
tara:strand:+ start:198 stop:1061 length:864 start_codon:yes stop_codon:yes gene_type:complete